MSTVSVFYECHKCKRRHPGDEHTPKTARMVPGTRPNELVFECQPACEKVDEVKP